MRQAIIFLSFTVTLLLGTIHLTAQNEPQLIYKQNFKYPKKPKDYQRMDTQWAVNLGVKVLHLDEDEGTIYVEKKRIKVVRPNGDSSYLDKSESDYFYRFHLKFIDAGPKDRDGYSVGTHLEKPFYAFWNETEKVYWILHVGNRVNCPCPLKVFGYVYKKGKKIRMLKENELLLARRFGIEADKR